MHYVIALLILSEKKFVENQIDYQLSTVEVIITDKIWI